jgi:hypothetical protein
MSSIDLSKYEAAIEAAEAEVTRLRGANAELADAYRLDPTDEAREVLRRGAASLAAARDQVDAARVALEIARKNGSPHGLLAEDGRVVGSIAVAIPGGSSSVERARLIDDALSAPLTDAAQELMVVLAAPPERFARERPGRDEQGRTVLEVAGRVEGGVLMPAVSRASKNQRGS